MSSGFEYNKNKNLPVYDGAYSTITDKNILREFPELASKESYSGNGNFVILSKPSKVRIHDGSHVDDFLEDTGATEFFEIFSEMSDASDLRCECFQNGLSNLLYGSSIPKVENIDAKGNEQEAHLAIIYHKPLTVRSSNQMYFGRSVSKK